ncbi:MAG: hypothetical protein L6R28_02205 [Planctomycetes bacterium]|nr:hypothetical protein [Planctomycetota bacterium]
MTLVPESTVIVVAAPIVTVSAEVGTVPELQLLAVFQFPEAPPVQVMAAAHTREPVHSAISNTSTHTRMGMRCDSKICGQNDLILEGSTGRMYMRLLTSENQFQEFAGP